MRKPCQRCLNNCSSPCRLHHPKPEPMSQRKSDKPEQVGKVGTIKITRVSEHVSQASQPSKSAKQVSQAFEAIDAIEQSRDRADIRATLYKNRAICTINVRACV